MFVAASIAGALFAGTPDVELRVVETEGEQRPGTVSVLSERALLGDTAVREDQKIGARWSADCTADACFREAMSSTSASAVVLLTVDQRDNVYRFGLDARSVATGERLASVDDVYKM